MSNKLEPINKQVVMQIIEEETNNAVFIPEQIRKKHLAKAIATGPNVCQVAVGDTVAFRSQLVYDLELSGEKYIVCDEEALLCIVRNES